MKDLFLSKTDTDEKNIKKIIKFVKNLEKENGLSEEEIKIKYTFGGCSILADTVRYVFANVLGKEVEYSAVSGNGKTHFFVILNDECFDINGKSSFFQLQDFVNSDVFQNEENWQKGLQINRKSTQNLPWFCVDHIHCEERIFQ